MPSSSLNPDYPTNFKMAQNVYIGQKLTNFTCQDMQLKFTAKKHLVWCTIKICSKAKSKKVYL